jgi:uncharacterized protein
MRSKTIHRARKHERTFAIALDEDEDPIRSLGAFAEQHELGGSSISAVGSFSSAVLGFVDRARGQHKRIAVDEPAEVLSLMGEIAHHDGKATVHLVALLGLSDGSTRGGRLLAASVSPALEIILREEPPHLAKTFDPQVELPLVIPPTDLDEVPPVLPSPIDEVPTWLRDLHPARRE